MQRQCAWCKCELPARGPPEELGEAGITHGICEACAELITLRQISLADLLEQLLPPVFCVNTEGRVQAANSRALQVLGKREKEVEGQLGGDVFECIYADEPGGCGKTIHCDGCTIRSKLMHTLSTGERVVNAPAHTLRRVDGQVVRLHWLVSTDLFMGGVLFAIKPATGPGPTDDP